MYRGRRRKRGGGFGARSGGEYVRVVAGRGVDNELGGWVEKMGHNFL